MIEILNYVIAVSLALSVTTGARLQKTGELTVAPKAKPLLFFILTVIYGISGISALLYFSWAYLNWVQIATFFVIWFTVASWVANANNKTLVWSVFSISVILTAISEIWLLLNH